MMKKIACLLLTAVFLTVLCGCSTQMTAVENYLIAIKKQDFEGAANTLSGKEQHLEASLYQNLNEDEKEVLQKLYALMQYSIGEETEENGVKFVSVNLKTPDVQRIFALADKQILVSAESMEKIVSDMIDNGSVAKTMMSEKTFLVRMTENDGKWLVDSGKVNQAFFDAVGFETVVRSLILN